MRHDKVVFRAVALCVVSFVLLEFYIISQLRLGKSSSDHKMPNALIADTRRLIAGIMNTTYFTVKPNPATFECRTPHRTDKIRLYRELLGNYDVSHVLPVTSSLSEHVSETGAEPGAIPNTAHYVWCGEKLFRFENYLAVLSAIKVLKPIKLVFHYNKLPLILELYHTWFNELRQSFPSLVLRPTSRVLNCDSLDSLNFALEQLASTVGGGVYLGERAVLTFVPSEWKHQEYVTYLTPGTNSSDEVIVFARHGLVEPNVTLNQFKVSLLGEPHQCLSVNDFNELMKSRGAVDPEKWPDDVISPCLVAPKELYPFNISDNTTPFGGVARILFYGKSDLLIPKPSEDPADFIPAVVHMITLKPDVNNDSYWSFHSYLSVLSALYVGGFHRVYVHGDIVPTGEWWDKLTRENVTFVYVQNVETVFQNPVKQRPHQSDILRAFILLKYGGVYQDKDIFWTTPFNKELLRYPTILCYDWPIYTEWPRGINLGLMMAKRNAPFLKHFLESFWYHDDKSWGFNGIQMPYKVYERNPETALIYDKLQVICYMGVCHPVWHNDSRRPFSEIHRPTSPFDLNETFALHFTYPKPDPSLLSYDTIRNGTNYAAVLGQRLLAALEKAGRWHLLDKRNDLKMDAA
ncbi:unnamed protein product [Lymnaea stagnalis]|uniref:Uncharacterized protein n=1 Tax=Lymnaea stagnalis TaxID=6523 RepID=A0AAV2HJT0_LYMST